ncbi:hypothetical protein SLS62_010221 [Diatrype stigma]|uniref:Prion-inhibition and propagation HeLo domain-containing protein n=1 Tax=Diatrype stigma TaxID=117547 RepID=A0AAN9YHN7_9PEZI
MATEVNTAIGLFQFSVQTLGRIQLARELRDDFETHQLKLDIIQLRLSRWGEVINFESIDVTDGNAPEVQPFDEEHDEGPPSVVRVLSELQHRLYRAQREARKFEKDAGLKVPQGLNPEACMPMDLKKLRNRIKLSLSKRKAEASGAFESIKWVFYKKEHFDKFIASISELINDLEKFIAEDTRGRLRKLSDEECKGIGKSYLEELKDIIEGCDPWLESSVDQRLGADGSGTVINQSHNTGHTVGVHKGENKGNTYGGQATYTFH